MLVHESTFAQCFNTFWRLKTYSKREMNKVMRTSRDFILNPTKGSVATILALMGESCFRKSLIKSDLPDCYLDHVRTRSKILTVTKILLCSKRNEILAKIPILDSTPI